MAKTKKNPADLTKRNNDARKNEHRELKTRVVILERQVKRLLLASTRLPFGQ